MSRGTEGWLTALVALIMVLAVCGMIWIAAQIGDLLRGLT